MAELCKSSKWLLFFISSSLLFLTYIMYVSFMKSNSHFAYSHARGISFDQQDFQTRTAAQSPSTSTVPSETTSHTASHQTPEEQAETTLKTSSTSPTTRRESTEAPTVSAAGNQSFSYDPARFYYGRPLDHILNLKPPHLLPGYKNPCWTEEIDSNETVRRFLPYFYLAGVAKSGTTDLYHRLTRHPHVLSKRKENHWWTRVRFGKSKDSNGNDSQGKPFSHYLSIFPLEKLAKKQQPFDDDWPKKYIIGDGTASLFWDNTAWRRLAEEQEGRPPLYDEPKDTQHPAYYIRHLQPKAKIIVILRNPITRTYSGYTYFQKFSSPAMFHESIKSNIQAFEQCIASHSVRACVYNIHMRTDFPTRLIPGMYYIHLLEWYKHFPKDQILILRLEDPVLSNLQKAYTFLELDKLSYNTMEDISNDQPQNSQKKKHPEKMFPETWKLLEDFYRPFNEKFTKMMNDSKYLWKNYPASVQNITYAEFKSKNK